MYMHIIYNVWGCEEILPCVKYNIVMTWSVNDVKCTMDLSIGPRPLGVIKLSSIKFNKPSVIETFRFWKELYRSQNDP